MTIKRVPDQHEGLRDRKRRETHDRIAEIGLKLFVENGFESTTLDAIASAAGISRRTFFHYFKSKEEVLLVQEGSGFSHALSNAIREEATHQPPIEATRRCFLKLASRYETKDSIVVDRLLRSTEMLRARKEALFVDMERNLYETMREVWPQLEESSLRIAAMISIGTLRLALDAWRAEEAQYSLEVYLSRYFAHLHCQL